MRYYKHLYLTEGLEKKKEKIIRKLEAGKLLLESIPFPLRNSLDEVVTLLAHSAHDKGLELTLSIINVLSCILIL